MSVSNHKPARWPGFGAVAVMASLLASLAGCGGGGASSDSGCSTLDPTRNANLPGCTVAPATPASVALSLIDAAGAVATSVAPDRPATVVAIVKNSAGTVLPGVTLTLSSSDKSAVFTPNGASALSDVNGMAKIGLAAGTQSGAFVLTASATINGAAITSNLNYSASFPTLSLSALSLAPATLAAGGTASLGVTVMNGTAAYAPAQSVVFSSPCAAAGKATISSPVATVNGVASTSYIDKGCGAADVITASTVFNNSTITQSGTLTVMPASAGQVGFVSALPQNIALKGTGGAGRQESSTVTFKVLDKNGNPVSGQVVNFTLNTSAGGLTVNPAVSTSGADGLVSTTVAAGTINTPVRVTAALAGGLSTLSDQLVVSTGVPEQNSFTLSSSMFNTEGVNFAGCAAPSGAIITARLGDHFHNPVPDGTAVSFTAEGGTVDASCLTGLVNTTLTDGTVVTQKGTPGACTVRFCAGNPRPGDGRVTVLAYALGEESFVDTNGNNQFDSGETYVDLGEPFRNDRAVTAGNANFIDDGWTSGNASRVAGEQYIDSNGSGAWDLKGDGQYNGVLRGAASVNTTGANTVHVRGALVQVLSTSAAAITPLNGTSVTLDHCVSGIPFVNSAKTVRVAVRDSNGTVFALNRAATSSQALPFDLPGNILPAGTTIAVTAGNGRITTGGAFTVPNTDNPDAANWIYTIGVVSDASQSDASGGYACTNAVSSGALTITATTPSGVVTTFSAYVVTD